MTEETNPPIRLKMKVGNLEFEIEWQRRPARSSK